jgi:DnaA-homolog protein
VERERGMPSTMQQIALDIGIDPTPSLDNFLAGPNEAALAHLRLWLGSALRSPVPTYLWGESGCGKSYLLRAVREALRERGSEVGWIDPSVTEPPEFKPGWSAVMFDDVQSFSNVQQHAAFNWFIHATSEQRAVFAAGSLPPADLKLRDDLRTRLGWGHVFELKVLSEQERRAVLRREADARGIFLSDEVIDYILSRFSRDLNSLIGLLQQLDGYALATKRAVTIPLIKSMLEVV